MTINPTIHADAHLDELVSDDAATEMFRQQQDERHEQAKKNHGIAKGQALVKLHTTNLSAEQYLALDMFMDNGCQFPDTDETLKQQITELEAQLRQAQQDKYTLERQLNDKKDGGNVIFLHESRQLNAKDKRELVNFIEKLMIFSPTGLIESRTKEILALLKKKDEPDKKKDEPTGPPTPVPIEETEEKSKNPSFIKKWFGNQS